jgi:glycosyltransferase involved in cell wall biosynthesis
MRMDVKSSPNAVPEAEGREVPKVSVVLPTYNSARFLGTAIQSVLDQTFQDWELIVVDDGSDDNTRDVLAAFRDPRIRYFYQENRGAPAALNAGLRLARGAYVAFLGGDDRWMAEKLALQVAQLDGLPPQVALVYADLRLVNLEDNAILGRFLDGREPPRGRVLSELVRTEGSFIHPCASLIRREVFDKVGLFDETLRTHEDWDLWIRIASVYEVEALDIPLAVYGRHPSQLTKDIWQMYSDGVEAKLRVLRSNTLPPADRRALRHYLAHHHYGYGIKALNLGRRKEAWEALLKSLRLRPGERKTYIHLGLPLLSPRLYRWFSILRERVLPSNRRSVRHSQ